MSKPESKIQNRKSKIEVVYPLRRAPDGTLTPFPTIYWLTDPALDRALADLERRGAIREIESILRSDAVLMKHFDNDHIRYRDARRAMLKPEDQTKVEASASLRRAFESGIAGIADFSKVKCLHAHTAHHLADPAGNTAAKLLIERFGLKI